MRRDSLGTAEARALVFPDENEQFVGCGKVPAGQAGWAVVVVQGWFP